MVLGISALRHADEAFSEPVTTVLSAAQYTIGRGQECDIVLEDPSRRISRKHASIVHRGDDYSLHVTSQINPVVVNGEVVTAGTRRALHAGDRMMIGEYEFSLVAVDTGDTSALPAASPTDLLAQRGTPVDLDQIFGVQTPPRESAPPRRSNEIDDLLGAPPRRASDPLLDVLGGARAHSGPGATALPSDPLAQLLGHDAASVPASTGSPEEFLHGAGGESPIDALLQRPSTHGIDPLGLSSNPRPQQGRGRFGGGVGGSDELDHVHDVHLPLPSAAPDHLPRPVAPSPARVQVPSAAPPSRPRVETDPLAALLGDSAPPAAGADPLGLFATPTAPATSIDPAGASARNAVSPRPAAGARVLPPSPSPIDFDVFDRAFVPEPPRALGPAASPGRSAVTGLGSSVPPLSPSDPLGGSDPVVRGSSSTDVLADLFSAETPRAAECPPELEPARGLENVPSAHPGLPPGMVGARTEPYASRPESPTAPDGARADAAIAAFLRGAGMQNIVIAPDQATAFLEECGAVVRAAVEGLMGMLLARAKVKEELRAADRTMVAARENNPLKLAESVEEALQFVFDRAARTDAFLPPPKALADACSDLQAHELALVAGMRAALLGAIKRFEPEIVEKRLQKEGSKSLLSNRKALLWDCFVAYYQQTQADADDNFDRVFGSAFLRAYQEQVRLLTRS